MTECRKERLIVPLIHGSGLRLVECVRLHVKDLDFVQRAIPVREGSVRKLS